MFFPIFSRENEKYCSAKETLKSLLIEQLLGIEDWKNCSKTFINFLREAIPREKCSFFEHCSNGGGVRKMNNKILEVAD